MTDLSRSAERPGSSPIDEDLAFQRWQWRAERCGWVVMIAVIACALAGLLGGGGPLARDDVTSVDGSRVQFARFTRYGAATSLDVEAASTGEAQIRVRISDEYLNAMNVQTITPAPTSSTVGERQYIFAFDRLPTTGATIRFQLEPKALGLQRGWVALDSAAPISFAHFIYP